VRFTGSDDRQQMDALRRIRDTISA